jgi:hypothetical protein
MPKQRQKQGRTMAQTNDLPDVLETNEAERPVAAPSRTIAYISGWPQRTA